MSNVKQNLKEKYLNMMENSKLNEALSRDIPLPDGSKIVNTIEANWGALYDVVIVVQEGWNSREAYIQLFKEKAHNVSNSMIDIVKIEPNPHYDDTISVSVVAKNQGDAVEGVEDIAAAL